jgi:hypothetical protein
LLREGIIDSDRVDRLDYAAEVFYRRLMSKVDDHGLFDARPSYLRAVLYPLRINRVREADISRWIAACETAGLLALYVIAGKPYLKMLDTKWDVRSKPKWPLPPWGDGPYTHVNGCEQLETVVPVVVDVVVVEGEAAEKSPRIRPDRGKKVSLPDGFCVSDRVRTWAARQGYAERLSEYLEAFVGKAKANGYRYVNWDSAFENSIREDWGKVRERPAPHDPTQPNRPRLAL